MGLKETARDWFRQCLAWDFSEKQRLARAAMAVGMGFSPEQYARPFPGSAPNVTNISIGADAPPEPKPAPPKPPAGKLATAALLGATLLGGGGAGAAALYYATREKPAETPAAKAQEWEWRVGDGPWKPVETAK